VNSDPIGATVLLDGRNTGKTTPADLLIRDIPLGMHTITIAKEGYLPTTPPWDIKVRVNPGQILCSILLAPICVPKNLIDNLWKEAEDVSGSDVENDPPYFNMEKIEVSTVSADQAKPKSALNSSVAQRLNELDQLKKDGIISDEEYKSKRKAILDSL